MYQDSQGRRWYKGNLHTHTSRSDGVLSPEESIALYRSNGYDFMVLTDHWKVSEQRTEDGMTFLSGCEYNFGQTVQEGILHIVGVGLQGVPQVERSDDAQTAIDAIHACGGFAILAHPGWSLNTPDQIRALRDVDATEIYNSVSGLPRNCRPYSGAIVDLMAAEGLFLPLVADDDTHFYLKEDSCRSYIWLQAEENTPEALMAALRQGRYYGSQGPILDIERTADGLSIRTSPVRSIVFMTDSPWLEERAVIGDAVTEANFRFSPTDSYVRVEATDAEGNTAWSSIYPKF